MDTEQRLRERQECLTDQELALMMGNTTGEYFPVPEEIQEELDRMMDEAEDRAMEADERS